MELDEIFKTRPFIRVTGIDLTQAMLDKLKQKHPDKNITLIHASYFDYDFGIEKYDAAVSFQTMHHFSHADKLKLYSRILAALKTSGRYIECDYMVDKQKDEDFYFSENARIRKEQGIAKKNARIFADNSIEAVTIANNHLYDYSDEGAEDTKEALGEAGVLWGEDENIIYLEKDGYRLAVICISTCGMTGGGGNLEEARSKLQYLKAAQEHSDFQIVYYHGGTEKSYIVEDWCVQMAKEYIDEGADLLLGAHPHVLQPLGEYNGVDIAYSLGNFCYGGHNAPMNRTMIYQYTIEVVDEEVASKSYNIIPCYVYTGSANNWQPDIIEDEDQINRVLSFMKAELSDPN